MRNKTDLLMAGYIGLASGLVGLIASLGLTLFLFSLLESLLDVFIVATPAVTFAFAALLAGRGWRGQRGSATWLEVLLVAPSTWAAPILFVLPFILPPGRDTRQSWLHPVWLLWFVPAYLITYLAARSKRKPAPGYCPQCGYDLTGNVSGICPECGQPIPLGGSSDRRD